ncbi:MAG: SusE domain-containing protein [Bacteroidales bacterium]
MKLEIISKKLPTWILCLCLVVIGIASCKDEGTDWSRVDLKFDIESSVDTVKLDEQKGNEVALSINWKLDAPLPSDDYFLEYAYELSLVGSGESMKEFVEANNTSKSYTNKQLQDILTNWGVTEDTERTIQIKISATSTGPTHVYPKYSKKNISVRTYGKPQLQADKLFLSGSSFGKSEVEMERNASKNFMFVYRGAVSAGTFSIPIYFANDEALNTIGPLQDKEFVPGVEEVKAYRTSAATSWTIAKDGNYRITVNLEEGTVEIEDAATIIDIDQVFIGGTASSEGLIELMPTLEDPSLYAWKGQLNVGTLYFPISFEGSQDYILTPREGGQTNIDDGNSMNVGSYEIVTASENHWTLGSNDTYRIVFDLTLRTLTVYSSATDMQNAIVTSEGDAVIENMINNGGYTDGTQEVTMLYMWGGFNGWGTSAPAGETWFGGFKSDQVLKQSLANPKVFVYSGAPLPVGNGEVVFKANPYHNSVYSFGADPEDRNVKVTVEQGQSYPIYPGNGAASRFAAFVMTSSANYIMVDVEKNVVVFDNRD